MCCEYEDTYTLQAEPCLIYAPLAYILMFVVNICGQGRQSHKIHQKLEFVNTFQSLLMHLKYEQIHPL